MMDHMQVRKLRDHLGVSQSQLARATGIHRTILSAFETDQLTLKGDCARRLEDFFKSRGVEIPALPQESFARRDPTVLQELRWIESRIREIEQADCESGFLDSFMEREREEREQLLVYLARQRALKMVLDGKARADVPVPSKPATQAEYLAKEYLKLREKFAEEAA